MRESLCGGGCGDGVDERVEILSSNSDVGVLDEDEDEDEEDESTTAGTDRRLRCCFVELTTAASCVGDGLGVRCERRPPRRLPVTYKKTLHYKHAQRNTQIVKCSIK